MAAGERGGHGVTAREQMYGSEGESAGAGRLASGPVAPTPALSPGPSSSASSAPSPPMPEGTRIIELPPPTAENPSVLLVGVAHVLDLESGLDRVLASFHPRALAVELDPERAAVLRERVEERERGGPGERKGSGGGGAPMLLRLWARMQDRFASDLGGVPGEEMLAVGAFAKKRALPCFLVDDPIRLVAPRLLQSLSLRERVQLVLSTLVALVIPTSVVEHEIADYAEHREEYLGVLREQYPTVTRVLLDERNVHMADRIGALARSYGRVAAVVGDAHVSGLSRVLANSGLPVEQVHLEKLMAEGSAGAPPAPTPAAPAIAPKS